MNVDLGIWSKLTRGVIVLLLVAGALGVAKWYQPLIRNNEALRKRILELEAHVQREELQNRKLEAAIHALQQDPKAVERIVRERLNWAKPGETVIRFDEPSPNRGPVRVDVPSVGALK